MAEGGEIAKQEVDFDRRRGIKKGREGVGGGYL